MSHKVLLHRALPRLGFSRGYARLSGGVGRSTHPRRLGLLALSAGAFTSAYLTLDPVRHTSHALLRCARAGAVATTVGLDYKYTLWRLEGQPELGNAVLAAKSSLHRRSAIRMREALEANGGVYIKLGQHIAAMGYLFPVEWAEEMRPLQDQCPATSMEEVESLVVTETGRTIEDIFSTFDPVPIGVASLAQVHRATLRGTGEAVAVKVQHAALDEHARMDIDTVGVLINVVERVFPEFEFGWLGVEMRESLPQEMDFVHEAQNAERVRSNFRGSAIPLAVPKIQWATRRVLCMELIEGSRVDDLAYLRAHGISADAVATALSRAFSEMIFLHGWVHCDPHPGNILIRSRKASPLSLNAGARENFDLVLLDHGLYRELTPEFRADYARLWRALIQADEEGIRKYSEKVSGTGTYRLFASMLTGRDWGHIASEGLGTELSESEKMAVQEKLPLFLLQLADILRKVPRVVLLLLKTNDLLRSVQASLRTDYPPTWSFVIMGLYCLRAIRRDETGPRVGWWRWMAAWTSYIQNASILALYGGWIRLQVYTRRALEL